jgi:cytochrome c peroxidase
MGVGGKLTTRNTPTVMNVAAREALFWDGRAATLQQQALFPIANKDEMNLPITVAVKRLNQSELYKQFFKEAFGSLPDSGNLGEALAAFERTLETANTPNDRWLNDEPNGMTEQQVRGRTVFRNKARCFDCHFSPDFTVDDFRNIGLFNGKDRNDSGRYYFTKDRNDMGKFKVPGLRNVAITAPYMHDGSFRTLREVIDYYDNPDKFVPDAVGRDSVLTTPLHLTEQEKQDLESFLNALTDDRFVKTNATK